MHLDRSPLAELRGSPAEQHQSAPRIVITLGDPAGIGPELVAKLLSQREVIKDVQIVVVADRNEFEHAASTAGADLDFVEIESASEIRAALRTKGIVLLHRPIDGDGTIARARVSERSGRVALSNLTEALGLVSGGHADALLYAPLNKASLRAAGLRHLDEAHLFAELLSYEGFFGEVSILGHLCTTRVTSHIGLRDVPDRITVDSVAAAIGLAHETLTRFGQTQSRVAVCGLNPHAGDSGMLGVEEVEAIAPAIKCMQEKGWLVDGPFPADSLFPKAWSGEFDAVVTMYHDQGQIALKAIGFNHGVTIHGGLPIPIVTPAQGSAFDIVGKGQATADAITQAFQIAVKLARSASA